MADREYLDRQDLYNAATPEQPEGFSVKNALLDMGKFALGMAVLGGASKLAGRSIYKSILKRNSALGENVAKVLGTTKSAAQQSINLGGLSRGVRHTLSENPSAVYNATTDAGKKVMQTLSSASRGSIYAGAFARGAYTRLASSKYTSVRMASNIGKMFYKSIPMGIGFYGVSRTLGIGDQSNQPSWYNIPGHIKEITKLTAENAVFDYGLGGAKRLGKYVVNKAAGVLNAEKSPAFNAFLDRNFAITRTKDGVQAGTILQRAIQGLAVLDGLREGAAKMSGRVTEAFMSNWGNKAARDAQKSALFDITSKRFLKTTFDESVLAAKTGYRSRVQSLQNYRAAGAHIKLQELTDILAKHHNIEGQTLTEHLRRGDTSLLQSSIFGTHQLMGETIATSMREHFESASLKAVAKSTIGGKILKRQMATGADILTGADRTHAALVFRGLKETASPHAHQAIDQLQDAFYNMHSRNVFKSTTGVVDYSMYSPKNLASSFLNFINPYFTVGAFGRELPLVKTLGLQKQLAKEGLSIYSIRGDEGQLYYDHSIGKRTVGDRIKNLGNRLGGVLVDGELHVVNASNVLVKADTNRMRMVYSTPYARDSALYKLSANAQDGQFLKHFANAQDEMDNRGFSDKIAGFASRWGLTTPSPIRWALDGLNKAFGFMPKNVGVKEAVTKMLDPRSTIDALGGDANAMMSAVSHMANESSQSLFMTLSDPEMWQHMGRLSKQVGHGFADRVAELKTAFSGTDEEVMNIIRSRGSFRNDEHLRYALEHYSKFGNYGLNEKVSTSFSMRKQPPTRRQEIARNLLNETLGMQGLPTTDDGASAFNFAKRLLEDNQVLAMLGDEQKRNLKMVSTRTDLFHAGYLDGSGRVASNYAEKAKVDAMQIIRDNLKGEEQFLQQKMFGTSMIEGIGLLGLGKKQSEIMTAKEYFYKETLKSHRDRMNSSPFILLEEGGNLGFTANSFIDRVMDMGNAIGLRYGAADRVPHTWKVPDFVSRIPYIGTKFGGGSVTLGGPLSSMMKRIGQGIGVLAAAQAVDAFTTDFPLFNGTMLDDGIFAASADVYVKANMAFHKVKDLTGITSAAKYLEGLMPSSTSTIPGAMIGGFAKGPLGIIPGAVINRFMDANNILPEFDKSYEEMKDTYSGRELVPIRRNRFWLFSKAPFEGDGPAYFRPHWYPKLKSQYKYTDTLYGSKTEAFLFAPWTGLGFNPIGHVLDKYHYERKHYWDRPYPVTAPAFTEVPVINKILSATIGRLPIIGKPLKYMHEDEMSHYYSTNGSNTSGDGELSTSNMPQVSQTQQYIEMYKKNNVTSDSAMYGTLNHRRVNPYGAMTVLGEQLYNFTELAGLRGYQLESLMGGGLADDIPRLQTANDMWSARRAFWDMNLGDIGGSTEFFRRFVPKEKKIWKKINPLRNKMASWLPSQEGDYFVDFLTGDPYTKVQEGEIRLPGDAYNKLYDVKRTFPGRASALGKTITEHVQSFIGLDPPDTEDAEDILEAGTYLHRYMQDSLIRANIGIKAEQMVYDIENDISGHIDLIMHDINGKQGKKALEIKTMHGKKFNKIKSPIASHVSQINFYLRQMQMESGTLLYINRDDPSQIRTFDVRYSEERFRKDLADLQEARKIAAGVMARGDGYETGTSYSWLDRLRILADVAPYSNEYKTAEEIVSLQMRENKLSEQDKEEVVKIKKHRRSVMRKYDMYPTRFKGRVFDPDTDYQLMSENENIKAAAQYSTGARMLGSAWERLMDMDTPLHTKLWNYKSPLSHYKSTRIYGTEAASWNKPYSDLLKPMFTKALATDNPMDAAASFGWIGALGLGGMGNMMLPGAVFGGMYGAARTVVGNDGWIPGEVQEKREIEKTFDRLKYERANYLYNMTGDSKYQTEADNTLWNISQKGYQVGVAQSMRALSNFEKPYFLSWMQETNPIERENILQMVPEDVGNMLRAKWGIGGILPQPSKYESMIPNAEWEGFMNNENLADIKVKTIEQAGLRAHDFGLGWYDQQSRISNSNYNLDPISSKEEVLMSNNIASRIKSALMRYLGQYCRRPLISISITPSGDDSAQVQLNLMRDRFNDIREAMRNR